MLTYDRPLLLRRRAHARVCKKRKEEKRKKERRKKKRKRKEEQNIEKEKLKKEIGEENFAVEKFGRRKAIIELKCRRKSGHFTRIKRQANSGLEGILREGRGRGTSPSLIKKIVNNL